MSCTWYPCCYRTERSIAQISSDNRWRGRKPAFLLRVTPMVLVGFCPGGPRTRYARRGRHNCRAIPDLLPRLRKRTTARRRRLTHAGGRDTRFRYARCDFHSEEAGSAIVREWLDHVGSCRFGRSLLAHASIPLQIRAAKSPCGVQACRQHSQMC